MSLAVLKCKLLYLLAASVLVSHLVPASTYLSQGQYPTAALQDVKRQYNLLAAIISSNFAQQVVHIGRIVRQEVSVAAAGGATFPHEPSEFHSAFMLSFQQSINLLKATRNPRGPRCAPLQASIA